MRTSSQPLTELLSRWSHGDLAAREALVPLVYDELRRIARRCLAKQRSGHTLEPTALVHEAYLRLAGRDSIPWNDRVHFFAVASQMMRQILVDHARKKGAAKRGARKTISLMADEISSPAQQPNLDVLALDSALTRLASFDPRQSQIVELRFFGGLSIEKAAEIVNISPATAKREWATARLWLHQAMTDGAKP